MDRRDVANVDVDAVVGEIAGILAQGYHRHQRKSRLRNFPGGLPREKIGVEPEDEIQPHYPDSEAENALDHSLAESVNGLHG